MCALYMLCVNECVLHIAQNVNKQMRSENGERKMCCFVRSVRFFWQTCHCHCHTEMCNQISNLIKWNWFEYKSIERSMLMGFAVAHCHAQRQSHQRTPNTKWVYVTVIHSISIKCTSTRPNETNYGVIVAHWLNTFFGWSMIEIDETMCVAPIEQEKGSDDKPMAISFKIDSIP